MLDRETAAAIESLRKEVEDHIKMHDMYIYGIRDAAQFVFNEVIGQLGPAERANVAARISNMARLYESYPENMLVGEHRGINDHYRRGVRIVFESILHTYDTDQDHPSNRGPTLTVIDGGKDDDS